MHIKSQVCEYYFKKRMPGCREQLVQTTTSLVSDRKQNGHFPRGCATTLPGGFQTWCHGTYRLRFLITRCASISWRWPKAGIWNGDFIWKQQAKGEGSFLQIKGLLGVHRRISDHPESPDTQKGLQWHFLNYFFHILKGICKPTWYLG